MTTRAPKTGTPKTSVLAVRVAPELREKVEQAAIAARTTVSGYIADTLSKAVGQRQATALPTIAHPQSFLPHQPSAAVAERPKYRVPANGAAPLASAPSAIAEKDRHQGDAKPAQWTNVASRLEPWGVHAVPTPAMPPVSAEVAELRRIGGGINQVAHTVNTGLPADAAQLVQSLRGLGQLFERDEAFKLISTDQSAVAELGRIANNLNQIARGGSRSLPAHVHELVQAYLAALASENVHAFIARRVILRKWHQTHDTPHPQARNELQDGDAVRSPRPTEQQRRPSFLGRWPQS